MSSRIDVLAVGNAIVDIFATCDDDFLAEHGVGKGMMNLVDSRQSAALYAAIDDPREISGGSAANTAVGIVALGGKAGFSGRIHDDELGSLLQSIKKQLSTHGALLFYSFPLQYDYLFYSRDALHWPLWPFKWLPPRVFERITRCYASLLNAALILTTGKSYKERISKHSHCNPTTKPRLESILQRAGYSVEFFETANIYPFKEKVKKRFVNQPIADRNLYGLAKLDGGK